MQRDEDEMRDKWVAVGKKGGGETVSLTQEKQLGWSKQDGVKIVFFFFFYLPKEAGNHHFNMERCFIPASYCASYPNDSHQLVDSVKACVQNVLCNNVLRQFIDLTGHPALQMEPTHILVTSNDDSVFVYCEVDPSDLNKCELVLN